MNDGESSKIRNNRYEYFW